MAARRAVTVPPPNCLPRDTLESANHAVVDSVLKELKQCTRRLQAAFASQQVDLQILDKLYYKGNNQHRTALFWRRVFDIRRFGRRLEEADVCGLVENFRLSFWGTASQNPKMTKNAWTFYPESANVRAVLQRLDDYRTFVKHMEEHVTKAHNHFHLELQTGAFLQLILTLTAIASRVAVLLAEIESAIEQGCQAVSRFLLVLDPSKAVALPRWLKHASSSGINATPIHALTIPRAPGKTSQVHTEEDLGMVVSTAVVDEVQQLSQVVAGSLRPDEEHVDLASQPSELIFAMGKPRQATSTVVRATVHKLSAALPSAATEMKRNGSKQKAVAKEGPKKRKKDEIDDIFGF